MPSFSQDRRLGSLRKALKATPDETVWQPRAGNTSAPSVVLAGADIVVKVIDERGNELPVIRRLGRESKQEGNADER